MIRALFVWLCKVTVRPLINDRFAITPGKAHKVNRVTRTQVRPTLQNINHPQETGLIKHRSKLAPLVHVMQSLILKHLAH